MQSSVVWLSEAIAEKDDILNYIAERNVLAALGIDTHIKQQVSQLIEFTLLGRKGRISGSFELVISSTPYLVAYQVQGDQVQILHVFHERRNCPPEH
ncbi:type II toxin-antitoxin system RelE/ParE family toxin [Solimicrobium silvestre]|uniref:Plasmid stabilization system protein n=1 Tax=Solimicrobium silvestre TaxID=2099400 RepID=A0A2S9GZ79_9BURK|nr:type II toxin-antitoxin system RelE/ParE family toxin [Solimicrobium silvestre]PRC93034.1 Plasmid stabilization system protein [Solimicrobium silvestre]